MSSFNQFKVVLIVTFLARTGSALSEDSSAMSESVNHVANSSRSQLVENFTSTVFGMKNDSVGVSLDELLEIWEPWQLVHRWSGWLKTLRDPALALMGASPDSVEWRNCSSDISVYFEALREGAPWALRLSDASGRAPKGVFWGNRYWIGSRELCDNLDSIVSVQNPSRPTSPPFQLYFCVVSLEISLNATSLNSSFYPILGLCLPRSCGVASVQRLLESAIASSPARNRIVRIKDVRHLNNDYELLSLNDPIFIGLLLTTCTALGVVLTATIFDVAGSSTTKRTRGGKVLLSFSAQTNMAKLLSRSVSEDTVAALHGIRFLSLLWVMLAHACLITFHLADNQRFRERAESHVLYQILSSGGLSVDTFFFISGFLASFLYFRSSIRGPDESSFSGVTPNGSCFRKSVRHFAAMMAYRLVRLTPTYLAMIAIVTTSMRWLRANVVADLPFADADNCPRYWWRNALYINTFFHNSERCMAWSWYLANDTQLYVVGALLLVLASSNFWLSTGVLFIVLASSWLTTASVALVSNHVTSFRDPFAHYDQLYDKPWVRAGPHLIGLVTGWLVWRAKPWLSGLAVATLTTGWIIAIAIMLTCMFGLYGEPLGSSLSAAHAALSHTAWALAVAWVLVTCASGRAGVVNVILAWRPLYPLSRLCYCAYLVHPQLMRIVLLLADSSLHISRGILAVLFIGFAVVSFTAALLLSLVYEAPFVSLFRIVLPRHRGGQENADSIAKKTSSDSKKCAPGLPTSWSIADFPY